MKNFILPFLLAFFFNATFAQEEITVKLKDKKFYDAEAIAYVVEIPQATYKDIERAWPKYLKDSPKEKVLEEKGLFSLDKKYLPKISIDSIDINSYIKEYDGHIILSVSFKLNGKYISDDSPDEVHYPTLEYVRNFAVVQYQNAVKDELNIEKKKFEQFESDFNNLVRENDNKQDAIKQYKRDILTNRDLITINEMDQSGRVLQIQAQKELTYKLVNSFGDEQKDAEKKLKEMEREFKQLQNKKDQLNNKIDNLQGQIRGNEREIIENEKKQKLLSLEKDDQEYAVQKLQKKLERIK